MHDVHDGYIKLDPRGSDIDGAIERGTTVFDNLNVPVHPPFKSSVWGHKVYHAPGKKSNVQYLMDGINRLGKRNTFLDLQYDWHMGAT